MTDKKQAANGQAPLKRKNGKASVAPSGSGQILAEYRSLLDSFYTLRIRWGDGEGQEVSYGMECRFIDRIRKWTRANLPDRYYGFILEKIITDISAYEFVDAPMYRSNDTFSIERDIAISGIREGICTAIRELIGQLPAPTPKPFETTAAAQYDKMLKEELPGFSICPFPKQVRIGTRHTYPTMYGGTEGNEAWVRDPARWDDIGRAVRNSGRNIPDGPLRDLLDGWSYVNIVPNGTPDPKDIPNPRHYLLDGAMIPHPSMDRNGKRLSQAANTAFAQFTSMVRQAWESPINLRDAAVKALLDRHFEKGGNPSGFVKFIEDWGPGYEVSSKGRRPTFSEPIQKALAAWVVTAWQRLGTTTTTTKPKPAKEWDDLKTLALFHALRYAAGDRQANLSTNTEADKVARDAGFVSKGSGKILRSHFNTYRNEAGRTGKGVRSTEVLKRYDAVIPRLEKGSKALKLATKEGELVLSREHS